MNRLAVLSEQWKDQVSRLRTDVYALSLARKDPRVPMISRLFAAMVVAYTCSPVDIIPDVIPLFGTLDDLILTPLGLSIALRLIPPYILEECRQKAAAADSIDFPPNWWVAAVVILIWVAVGAALIYTLFTFFANR